MQTKFWKRAFTGWGLSGAMLLLTGWSMPPTPAAGSLLMAQAQQLPIEAEVTLAGQTFQLEIARTPQQQSIGLMHRAELPANRGMLFPYQPAQPVSFWMFNVSFDLDLLFILDGQIVAIAESVPGCAKLPCPSYSPGVQQKVSQVLELPGGTTAKLGIRVGDRVQVKPLKAG
ncbi:MAG: DUF192 domain-containing protein [Cyanobacteriota bacterium]|nr:DUF192 domain-containing protein [Cyanobacteriota bacterium]